MQPFAWMLGKWELREISTPLAQRNSKLAPYFSDRWLYVTVGENGGLKFHYQYNIGGAGQNLNVWNRIGDRMIEHTEELKIQDGRLIIQGVKKEFDQESVWFKMSREVQLDDLVE